MATLITESTVAVPEMVDQVSVTIPAGKSFICAYVKNLEGYTEELGINGHATGASTITTDLRGMDSVAGQHEIVYQFAAGAEQTLAFDEGSRELTISGTGGNAVEIPCCGGDTVVTVTPAKQFTVTTFGPIHSCSCPCTEATSMVQKGEIIAVYVDHPNVPSGVVYAEVISASRDLSQAGNHWVYTLGIESTTLTLTKEHIKCFGCP